MPAGAAPWVLGARRLVRDHHLLVQDRHGAGAGGRRHGARSGPQPRGDEGGGEEGDTEQIALLCFLISHFGISSCTSGKYKYQNEQNMSQLTKTTT